MRNTAAGKPLSRPQSKRSTTVSPQQQTSSGRPKVGCQLNERLAVHSWRQHKLPLGLCCFKTRFAPQQHYLYAGSSVYANDGALQFLSMLTDCRASAADWICPR
jgi:hypothetical protein